MRTVLLFSRLYIRPQCANIPRAASSIRQRIFTPSRHYSAFRPPKPPAGVKRILCAGALGPAAFVTISQNGDDDDGKTGEQQMLEASRKELDEHVPKRLQNSKRVRKGIYFFIEDWIIEPIATGVRFLHLVIIFVPVILTVPAVWIGARQKDKSNERSGTLWWYWYLVWSMERAGAAFIKVWPAECKHDLIKANAGTAWTVGSIENRHLPD
jgi:aarF domain-containing kinase